MIKWNYSGETDRNDIVSLDDLSLNMWEEF